ncbi:MAG: creatininase family protein [Candidatus Heimdallarchaeota archaeon]|nr:MAG: creatininase family protein [Candidatus Heimdallarchaeota archaeon]
MSDFLNLKGKMSDWGPFKSEASNTLIFSMGNPYEGHGPALSPDNDSRCANFVAYHVSERSGAKFVAHIPYTTDQVGEIALDWSPVYIPMEECVNKCVDYIDYHCKILQKIGIVFSRILIINGHGGNYGVDTFPIWDELKQKFPLSDFMFLNTYEVEIDEILQSKNYSSETNDAYLTAKKTGGHADTIEHSIATLYGGVDYGKFYQMNNFIIRNGTEAALRKWPVLGGLGGYLKFGGEKYEPLRKVGLERCLSQFEEDGQIFLFPELGQIVIEHLIKNICAMIQI